VVALVTTSGDQAQFVVMVDPSLTQRGVDARALAADLGARLGGRGGGRADLAQGGGKQVEAAPAAVAAMRDLVAAQLK
jgi:alanyl-tRNA synthetase